MSNSNDNGADSGSTEAVRTAVSENSHNQNNSDNPGMALVSVPLTEKNYMPWVRGIKIALAAKDKLGYIDGRFAEPSPTDPGFDKWKKADSMVHSWLLNSISGELREQFMYCASSKNLWDELLQIFGMSNGPMVF